MEKKFYSLVIVAAFLSITLTSYGQGSISPLNPTVCAGNTITFTASGSSATTGYTWSTSGTILSGQGSKTVTIRFNSSGYVSVSGSVAAGTGVQVYTPAGTPTPIAGPSTICAGGTATFTSSVSNATQIVWVAPNATIVSQNGGTVTVSFPSTYTSGQIVVYGIGGSCGAGPSATKPVSSGGAIPASPGAISGSSSVAPGQTGVSYSVGVIANATSYEWSLPAGASIATGSGTRNITVNFSSSFTGGAITVRGTNASCPGAWSSPLTITLSTLPGPAGSINGGFPCMNGSDVIVTYSVPPLSMRLHTSGTLVEQMFIP